MIKAGKLYQFNLAELTRKNVYIRVGEVYRAYDAETALVVVLAVADEREGRPNPKREYMLSLLLPDGLVGDLLAEQGWFEEMNSWGVS